MVFSPPREGIEAERQEAGQEKQDKEWPPPQKKTSHDNISGKGRALV